MTCRSRRHPERRKMLTLQRTGGEHPAIVKAGPCLWAGLTTILAGFGMTIVSGGAAYLWAKRRGAGWTSKAPLSISGVAAVM
jgi:hypothetical protein